MTDELLRPFRDKIRGRASASRPAGEHGDVPSEEVRPDTIMIRDVAVGDAATSRRV